jgi:hypothetical protein
MKFRVIVLSLLKFVEEPQVFPISFFADDSLLFFKVQKEHATRVKETLDLYASSTGQLINPSKCSILFGNSCPVDSRSEVKTVLQVTQKSFEAKYLGLPTSRGTDGCW